MAYYDYDVEQGGASVGANGSSGRGHHLQPCGESGGSVTLAFRRNEKRWRDEYLINLAAALVTGGDISHVELAIGNVPGSDGQQMSNVLRIYNDNVGVELCERTGKSPNYRYLQLGCTKEAEQRMLEFAKQQVGKPFSRWGMARSIIWPRKTTFKDFFCAELVAATLKVGNIMSRDSNPGAATPQSLYNMYESHATTTGNPCVLRGISMNAQKSKHRHSSARHAPMTSPAPPMISNAVVAPAALFHTGNPSTTASAAGREGYTKVQCHETPVVNMSPTASVARVMSGTQAAPAVRSPAEEAIRRAARGACARMLASK